MKLSFSTIALPNANWKEICSIATDVGFDAIEVRGVGSEVYAYCAPPFTMSAIDQTRDALKASNLSLVCFSTDTPLCDKSRADEAITEISEYIRLAERTGTPFIRVLGDEGAQGSGEVDDRHVADQLKYLAPIAAQSGVRLLVESNGAYADTARLRRLLEVVGSDSVAALWDMMHPYRFFGESPDVTIANLGAYIKHVHVKDSVMEDGEVSYRLMGEGDLPVSAMIQALSSINYSGFLSYEWAPRWGPDMENPGIAIAHYFNYMNSFTQVREAQGSLQDNKTRTGKFIWEKETLIDLTFPQLLDRVAETFPDQTALDFADADYTRTYREFRDEVDVFARALIAMGVQRGDKVAVWATNVPAWFITFWAATKIGAILVTVNSAYKIHEAEYLLRQSDTHTLVLIDGYKDSDYVGIIREICPELDGIRYAGQLHSRRLPFLRNVITVDSRQKGCLTWEEANAKASEVGIEAVYRRMASILPSDVCNMQYTSGTTGFPKGVMLTHYNVINNGKNIGDRMDLSTADRMMIQVPMFHCFGMVLSMTACVTHAASMCPVAYFSPARSLACVTDKRITAFNGVPTMFIAMLAHEDFSVTDFSRVRTGIMAGSPCPVKVMREVIDRMNMSEITIVFGQTESSPGCTMSTADDPVEVKVATVGRPLPGIECKIVDPVTGEDLGDDEDGEFVARGYNIMKGYYKMPSATASVIDARGWLHTGDLARRRGDGNFVITGRIKDMIIRGGENIYPKEIEDFIYTHPQVSDVQVIGVPDKAMGEEIMACVIAREGEVIDPEEIREFVRSHMAKHKTPRYVRFVDSFPMNAAGKILKFRMVEEATAWLGLGDDAKRE